MIGWVARSMSSEEVCRCQTAIRRWSRGEDGRRNKVVRAILAPSLGEARVAGVALVEIETAGPMDGRG